MKEKIDQRALPSSFLTPHVSSRIMATGGAGPASRRGGMGDGHRSPVAGPFQPDQMELAACMGVMTGETGYSILVPMELMKVLSAVAKSGCRQGFFSRYQGASMTLEAELLQLESEQVFIVGGVRGVAAEAVAALNRPMDAFLAGPVFVAFVTESGTPLLGCGEPVIDLMVAVRQFMARDTSVAGQRVMYKGSGQLVPVALETGLTAEGIDGRFRWGGRCVCLLKRAAEEEDGDDERERVHHRFHGFPGSLKCRFPNWLQVYHKKMG
jgi:hypothetical protein